MWSSIKEIYLPKTFKEAIESQSKSKGVFYGGGTYLTAQKGSKIRHLIDINKIVDKTIQINAEAITIGASVTLQKIIEKLLKYKAVSYSARYSCYSKNIRNQRTIGGEIAERRVESELFSYLLAINPLLDVRTPKKEIIYLRNWSGKGILNKLSFSKIDLNSSGIARFAVLPSAPAFVIVVIARKTLELDFVISGKAKKVYGQTIKISDFDKQSLEDIVNRSIKYFKNDQYGTIEYKKAMIVTGIQRAVEKIK